MFQIGQPGRTGPTGPHGATGATGATGLYIRLAIKLHNNVTVQSVITAIT